MSHLGSQKSRQVDLRDHLAATITFLLVSVLVVLNQVPDLHPALQVRSDHGGAGAHAVWASSVLYHVLCGKKQHNLLHALLIRIFESKKQCLLSVSVNLPTFRHRQ